MDYFSLGGIKIASSSQDEISCYLQRLLISPEPSLIVTFNLDFYRVASENEKFNNICKCADIVVPDGYGIVHLIQKLYRHKINRITGNDLFSLLLNMCSVNKLRVAFLGSNPEVLSRLKEKVIVHYPTLIIASAISPPLYFERDHILNRETIAQLKVSKPDILFAALGCPRQELWLYENMREIGASINIGIGAVFDFYSGFKKRSPKFIQNLSLEWLWRMIHEPGRLGKRYLLKDLPFYLHKRFARNV